jgi:hypothetical protein
MPFAALKSILEKNKKHPCNAIIKGITWGANKRGTTHFQRLYKSPFIKARFVSIRRILISAATRHDPCRNEPFFPNTMGYLQKFSPRTFTTRPLSQGRKNLTPPKEVKTEILPKIQKEENLTIKLFYHKPVALSIRCEDFY